MFMKNISFSTYGRMIIENRIFPTRTTGINKVYYINSGSIICKTASQELVLQQGHLYLIPQNLNVTLATEYVDHSYFDFFSTPTIIMHDIIDIDLREHPLIASAFDILNSLVEKHSISITQRDAYYDLVKSYLNNLLFLIDREYEIPTITDDAVNSAIEYMHKHYFLKMSVEDLAERYHLEEGTFIRRFKKYTNTTPYKYLKTLRVNVAESLMEENAYTLAEIAEMVGYSDAATLSHAITKSYLKNPNNAYRYVSKKEKLRDYEAQAKYGEVSRKDF
ncbi:MAG: helix-turn-helix domain-containing protein [Clostridia bacterium]|nr:helix-turn-helix domain-containing protein [Clostridia bacterium]